MVPLDDRAIAVFTTAWRMLPPIRERAFLTAIGTTDLGARHGSYSPDDGRLSVHRRLFVGNTPAELPLFDVNSEAPPKTRPFVSRALATTLHELFHAIGAGTGLDRTQEWYDLSGFVESPETPNGTGRYFEARPGWSPMGPSEWRYRLGGNFFPRAYASRSPYECFADCCTHIALGWSRFFSDAPAPYRANALAKLAYLRRHVWQERGTVAVSAARERWQKRVAI